MEQVQRMQSSSLQPPVQQQRIDQKKLLEQHIQQDVQEHVRHHLEQQQRQRAAAQFRQQQQQIQQQTRLKQQHQQMMMMDQQKRAAAALTATSGGGVMYSSSLPHPHSHKPPPMVNQPLGFMPTSVMKHNFKQTRILPEMNKPSTRLEQDLNQKAVSTHSSLTGLLSHSIPEDDHQFLQHDQPRPPYGYSSLPRMGVPPIGGGGGPRYPPLPHYHHHPAHHMMGAPPPPGYPMMGPTHPHHMPPFPNKHNSLPQGSYFNWNQ